MIMAKRKGFFQKLIGLKNLTKKLPLVVKLVQDSRVPFVNKLIFIGVSLIYFIVPFDLIPDVPIIGHIDDFFIFIFFLNWFIEKTPENILADYDWIKD